MNIAVALSGGVDSAVALAYLSKTHNVHAFTMKLWNDSYSEELKNSCFGPNRQEDIDFCESLCKKLNVPYTVIDLSSEFKAQVIAHFKLDYSMGRTPNPCVTCNKNIKFGSFLNEIKKIFNFDYVATGHYASIEYIDGTYYLKRVAEDSKDQTYFLYSLNQFTLSHLMLPLPSICKSKQEVRKLAEEYGIEIHSKKDSMNFADGKYAYLFTEIEQANLSGKLIYKDNVVAQHKGIMHYTIGQRARISGKEEKLYVKNIDWVTNNIEVDKLDAVTKDSITFFYFDYKPLFLESAYLLIKLKQEGKLLPIKSIQVYPNIQITLDTKVILTPGQSCVIYNEDGLLVAGGVI